MSNQLPLAVFAMTHPWLQASVREAVPAPFMVQFLDPYDSQAAKKLLPQADFLVTTYLPSSWIPLLRRCQLVQLQGVGSDRVDTLGLQKANIPIAQTPEGMDVGVAEHTVLFILALYKRLLDVNKSVRQGHWDEYSWRKHCHFFHGKTLGLVGFGRIGQRVARLARAFDVHIIYFDPFPADALTERALSAEHVSFLDLLDMADIVSVHVPLSERTRHLFSTQEYSSMRRGSIFINTSRGGTYDMDALYEAVRSGHLAGAGLDVFDPEPPPPDHPLFKLPTVLCTPHMAAGTVEAQSRKVTAQFANMERVRRGELPFHQLTVC